MEPAGVRHAVRWSSSARDGCPLLVERRSRHGAVWRLAVGFWLTALVAGRACERKRAGVSVSVHIAALVAGRACERKRAGVSANDVGRARA